MRGAACAAAGNASSANAIAIRSGRRARKAGETLRRDDCMLPGGSKAPTASPGVTVAPPYAWAGRPAATPFRNRHHLEHSPPFRLVFEDGLQRPLRLLSRRV